MAINVFGWNKGVIVHQISKQPEDIPRINLLLIGKAGKFHYAWIKDLNRLLYDSSKHKERKHFCARCLHGYTREDQLEAHKPECRGIGQTAVRVDMPKEGENKLAFQNYHKQLLAPYIIYADFEALTAKVEGPKPDPAKSNTQRTQHHEVCSYSYIVLRCDGCTEPPVEYRGPNAAGHFLESLQEEEREIKALLADPKAMRMTLGNWHAFRTAEMCHVCDKPLEGDSVSDHCHITGKYRGVAHTACNLKVRLSPKNTTIPVVFHNLHDLEYPEDLHDAHNAYPLAPERMAVKKGWMSEYQHSLLCMAPTEVEKLVPNLRNKGRYVLHYRNLQLYMSQGLRLTAVHRALRFDQSPWMEPYIRKNTELRKKATSGFEKDLYKLMNNFGKTMENLWKRVDVKLVRRNEEDKLRRLIASPVFAWANIFDDDLVAIQVHKSRLELNRRVYVGMSVLDLSKHLMYDFYYNELRKQCGDQVSSFILTPTVSSSRSKRRMSTKTWPNIQSSMTPRLISQITHCTAPPTKRCWGKWRMSVQGAPLPNALACTPRCTLSLRLVAKTSRKREKECRK